jgi:hypothetical protein
MKQSFTALALAAIVLLGACGKQDDEGSAPAELVLQFTSSYAGQPLLMFERAYSYEEDMAFKVQLLQFYISDVRLLRQRNGSAEEVPVLDVASINFGAVYNDEDAAKGISTAPVPIEPGQYTGLKLGFGVSPQLNATIPPDYALGHPLAENYWEDANSYIFYRLEGNADLNGDGNFPDKLTFHVGGDNNYNELEFQGNFSVDKNGRLSIPLDIDLRRLLVAPDGEFLDFRQVRQAHSVLSPAAIFLSGNAPQALRLK